ncbi:MAG: hypothetical protein H7144_02775 [Burkholderiales bacterium]|nr:hypothetical protein [Phycisphaerae bacterium]
MVRNGQRSGLSSPVNIAAMSDIDNEDDQPGVLDRINDSLIADSDAISVFTLQLDRARRARIDAEGDEPGGDAGTENLG